VDSHAKVRRPASIGAVLIAYGMIGFLIVFVPAASAYFEDTVSNFS